MELNTLLNKYYSTTAFLIGNGIHYQYKDCNLPWNKLLEELWFEYTGEQGDIPKGISFTEFYDVLELTILRKNNESNESIKSRIKRFADAIKDKNINFTNINKQIVDLASKPHPFDIHKVDREKINQINNSFKEIANKSRAFCNENYDNTNTLSDRECIQLLMNILTDNNKKLILTNSIKTKVARKFPDKQQYKLSDLIIKIKEFNSPILTTNFDVYIEKSVMANRFILSPKGDQYKFTDYYPWNLYYSTNIIDNPLDGFGIWHINGLTDYPRSIKLGLSDYMGCVERVRKMIQSNGLNEFFDGKNRDFWIGSNTWLHVIFNKDLFIFGLALEENEAFLRWLLIQRAKYNQMYQKRLKGWFIGDNISNGKSFFLKQLGFDVIEISDYNKFYQVFTNV